MRSATKTRLDRLERGAPGDAEAFLEDLTDVELEESLVVLREIIAAKKAQPDEEQPVAPLAKISDLDCYMFLRDEARQRIAARHAEPGPMVIN